MSRKKQDGTTYVDLLLWGVPIAMLAVMAATDLLPPVLCALLIAAYYISGRIREEFYE